MTNKDYELFEELLRRYVSFGISFQLEYSEWIKTHRYNDPHSEILETKGSNLDEAGKALRKYVKGFVNE